MKILNINLNSLFLAIAFVIQFSQLAFADAKSQDQVNIKTIEIQFQNQNGQLLFKTPVRGTIILACCDGGDSGGGTDRGSWDPEQVTIENPGDSEHLQKTLLRLLIANHCLEAKISGNKAQGKSLIQKIQAEGLLTEVGDSLSLTLIDPLPENLACILDKPITPSL